MFERVRAARKCQYLELRGCELRLQGSRLVGRVPFISVIPSSRVQRYFAATLYRSKSGNRQLRCSSSSNYIDAYATDIDRYIVSCILLYRYIVYEMLINSYHADFTKHRGLKKRLMKTAYFGVSQNLVFQLPL